MDMALLYYITQKYKKINVYGDTHGKPDTLWPPSLLSTTSSSSPSVNHKSSEQWTSNNKKLNTSSQIKLNNEHQVTMNSTTLSSEFNSNFNLNLLTITKQWN